MNDNFTKNPSDVITSDTDNATIIPVSEAPPHKQQKFKRLREYNTGRWNGPKREETEVIRREDDLHRYDAIASSLDITNYQKSKGREIFDNLSFHDLGESIDEIAFVVCMLVANDNVNNSQRYSPQYNWGTSDDRFEKVAENIGISQSKQMSLYRKVEWKVNP